MTKEFYGADDIATIMGISKSKAYDIIKILIKDYKKEFPNCITIQARIPKWFFEERVIGKKRTSREQECQ